MPALQRMGFSSVPVASTDLWRKPGAEHSCYDNAHRRTGPIEAGVCHRVDRRQDEGDLQVTNIAYSCRRRTGHGKIARRLRM